MFLVVLVRGCLLVAVSPFIPLVRFGVDFCSFLFLSAAVLTVGGYNVFFYHVLS